MQPRRRHSNLVATFLAALLSIGLISTVTTPALAQTPSRSFTQLVSSNGFTGVVLDLDSSHVHHFRDHVFATEEPRWDSEGIEIWEPTVPDGDCFRPQSVSTRDLLRDAYFGLAVGDTSLWLNSRAVDLDASGYDGDSGRDGRDGGTSIMRMVQPLDELELIATTRVFAPWSMEWPGFVMLLEVTNDGEGSTGAMSLYGLVNANLGAGRPGPRQETGSDDETIGYEGDNGLLEQGFAGLVYIQGLGSIDGRSHSPATFYDAVVAGSGDLPTPDSSPVLTDGAAGALQWNVTDLAPGDSVWVGVVVSYDPNPDYLDRVADTDDWIDGRDAETIWDAERTDWAAFQARLDIPDGVSDGELDLLHHSATVLRMAQVRETQYYLRQNVDPDVQRYTGIDDDVDTVGDVGLIREHDGYGALVASLPPGEWAYSWVRDGAYGIVGLTDAGLYPEARDALTFYINAENDRYSDARELSDVPLLPYGVTLTRYHGFGIEESDTTCNGDFNFEWDGFGLFLWALQHYVSQSGDTTILDDHWPYIRDRIANVIEALVEADSGLVYADSSIWEVHWAGDQKHFAYTSITAARGLCDAAALATAMGDTALSSRYEAAGRALRLAIYEQLTNSDGAIAANTEELAEGLGYWDAAVIEAVSMGLFDPNGPTATATLNGVRDALTVPSGTGLSRNDDQFDGHGRSDYGGPYDSLEWIFIDYRMSIGARHAGLDDYADDLQDWVRDQTLLNYLLIGENYDQNNGEYRNNAPMIGFGAGSYITATRQRAGDWDVDAACGVYFEDDPDYGPPEAGDDVGPGDGPVDMGEDATTDATDDLSGDVENDTDEDSSADAALDLPDTTADVPGDTSDDTSQGDSAAPDVGSDPSATNADDDGCGCAAARNHDHRGAPVLVLLFGLFVFWSRRHLRSLQ